MSGASVFIYTDELETILGSARSLRKILVFGGPAMGKSTVIEALRDRSGRRCELVRGRRGDPEVVERIVGWATDPKRRASDLLIDNLDHVFSEEVERALRDLPDVDEGLGRIIATSGTPTKWLEKAGAAPPAPARADLNLLVHDSTALNAFHHLWLDPWGHGWERTTTLRIQGAIKRAASEEGGPEFEELAERDGRKAYAELLVGSSGGHPSLLGAAFRWLIGRLERQAWRREHASDLTDGEEVDDASPGSLREHLEYDLVESQLETIGRAVDWVEAQSADALDELVAMAQSGQERDVVAERMLLSKAGLVRRSVPGGPWGLPCAPISECVLHRHERMPAPQAQQAAPAGVQAPPAAPGPAPRGVVLEPDARVPDMQGRVVWSSGGLRRELSLSGASWRILAAIAAAEGALVTVPEIAESIEQESHKAVRSALQRLVGDLRKSGLDGLIVNVRRQGYLYDGSFCPAA
ncbi:MAG: hypothetical protein GY898_08220 [Proteobacteria bacterium]|nr:hypothetical protein [Pseudomonadota bacterium]